MYLSKREDATGKRAVVMSKKEYLLKRGLEVGSSSIGWKTQCRERRDVQVLRVKPHIRRSNPLVFLGHGRSIIDVLALLLEVFFPQVLRHQSAFSLYQIKTNQTVRTMDFRSPDSSTLATPT